MCLLIFNVMLKGLCTVHVSLKLSVCVVQVFLPEIAIILYLYFFFLNLLLLLRKT